MITAPYTLQKIIHRILIFTEFISLGYAYISNFVIMCIYYGRNHLPDLK